MMLLIYTFVQYVQQCGTGFRFQMRARDHELHLN